MDFIKLRSILGWSAVVNFMLLLFFGVIVVIGKGFIYGIWNTFFDISSDTYDIIVISFIGFWKIAVLVFFLIPYIAMGIVNKK